jgi:hypothetical protein
MTSARCATRWPTVMFDYDARPVTPGVILVGTIGTDLGQGQPALGRR